MANAYGDWVQYMTPEGRPYYHSPSLNLTSWTWPPTTNPISSSGTSSSTTEDAKADERIKAAVEAANKLVSTTVDTESGTEKKQAKENDGATKTPIPKMAINNDGSFLAKVIQFFGGKSHEVKHGGEIEFYCSFQL